MAISRGYSPYSTRIEATVWSRPKFTPARSCARPRVLRPCQPDTFPAWTFRKVSLCHQVMNHSFTKSRKMCSETKSSYYTPERHSRLRGWLHLRDHTMVLVASGATITSPSVSHTSADATRTTRCSISPDASIKHVLWRNAAHHLRLEQAVGSRASDRLSQRACMTCHAGRKPPMETESHPRR